MLIICQPLCSAIAYPLNKLNYTWLGMIDIIIWNRRKKLVELNISSIARDFESKRNAAQNKMPQRPESVFKIQIWEFDTKYTYGFHDSKGSQICGWFFI